MSGNYWTKLKSFEPGRSAFWWAFVVVATVSAIADLTKFSDLPPQFIGHADQANMAIVARNIAEGKGAVVDTIWLLTNGGIPGNDIPIPEPYWSVYVAGIIGVFFFLFGAGLTQMLVPAVLMKVSMAAIASGMTLRITRSTYAAFSVAIPLLYLPIMTRSVKGLSDIYLSLFMLCTTVVLAHAIVRNALWLFFMVGLLIGIAIGIKPSGLLLLGLLLGYLVFSGNVKVASGRLAVAAIGLFLGLLPLIHHNYQGFDSAISPAGSLVREAGIIRLATFDHNEGFYNPNPNPAPASYKVSTGKNTLATMKGLLNGFLKRVANGGLIPVYFLPFVIIGVAFIVLSIRSLFLYKNASLEFVFSIISVQMLIAALVLGSASHWEPRYFNFVLPFLIILALIAVTRLTDSKAILAAVCAAITAGSLWLFTEELGRFRSKPVLKVYEQAAILLPPDAIVFTSDPWEFSFHTKLRSVMLPYTDDESSLLSLAERYGVEYIVIVHEKIRHPTYQALIDGDFPEYLEPVEFGRWLTILKFKSR